MPAPLQLSGGAYFLTLPHPNTVELKRPTGDAVAVPRNVSCLVAITYSATVLSPPNTVELKILTGDAVAVACNVCSELGMPVRATITGGRLLKMG